MKTDEAKYWVFDHDFGTLRSLAEKQGFSEVLTVGAGTEIEQEASGFLIKNPNWKVAFVHILDDPWTALCNLVPDGLIVVRFSKEGFPPTPPEGVHGLCIRCLKKIHKLTPTDLKVLKEHLPPAIEGLKNRLIPEQLAHLISFEEPHRLRALHTVLLGVLAVWASDPTEQIWRGKAQKKLGNISIPPLPSEKLDHRKALWRFLGLKGSESKLTDAGAADFRRKVAGELGVKIENFGEKKEIAELIEDILNGNPDEIPNHETVLTGWDAIDSFLKMR